MEYQPPLSKVIELPTHRAMSPAAAVNAGSIEVDCLREDPMHPPLGPTFTLPKDVGTEPRATGNDAAIGIGKAYDRIHRIQAILAYLKIMNRNNQGVAPLLDEAKHTYGQALSLYEARDFEGALEFASASRDLSRALEIVISTTLRSDSMYPSLVLLPPEHETTLDDSIRMQEELYRVECLLSLIHRVAENGTSLSEDATQTLNIASCSERLLRKARHLLRFAEMQEAIDLVRAAAVTADAAEHVCCRRWYAMQGIDPSLPTNRSRAMCDASGRDCECDGSSRKLDLEGEVIMALVDQEGKARE
jgi:hypothetical protein